MRPRELTLSGFRSYVDETTFSWEGRTLVGIVGPIGSGKSSILDAVSFALYGKTPRVERDTKSLINQRRDALHVSLTFDVDGVRYKAVRSLRRGGASAHALYRISSEGEVGLSDRSREMSEKIEALLGLDFDAFRRSVLLAQNQFAGFLEAAPAERDKVLKGVFGLEILDSMKKEVERRHGELRRDLDRLEDRRKTAADDRVELAAKRLQLQAAEDRASALEALRKPFGEVKERIVAADRDREGAAARLRRLNDLAARIPDAVRAAETISNAGSAAESIAAAELAAGRATEVRAAATADLDAVLEVVGGRDGLIAVNGLVVTWKAARDDLERTALAVEAAQGRLATGNKHLQEVAAAAAAAVEAESVAAEIERVARKALDDAAQELRALHQLHRAHALRTGLTVGAACPVCQQEVLVIPALAVPAEVDGAERGSALAESNLQAAAATTRGAAEESARAQAEKAAAAEAVASAEHEVDVAEQLHEAAAVAVAEAAEPVGQKLGGEDPESALETLRARASAAEEALERAMRAESVARDAVDSTRREGTEAEAGLGSLRAELATLAGHLGSPVVVGESSASIRQALEALRAEWAEQRAAAEADGADAGVEAEAATAALSQLLEAAGLGSNDDVVEVIAAAVAERSAKEAEVALLERHLADLSALAADEAELSALANRLSTLKEDLTDSRFLRFLLDERRQVLADLASEHFEELSAGRYRFDESGQFQVVDLTAADQVRSPSSLSGGETFLAALALALALAEIVSREGGRLDAFFLDEGFGSLDPEHLDLAMDGVERLVTARADRLVVVVSHVPAMAERIEDLISLDRDAVTGNTVVVSGAVAP